MTKQPTLDELIAKAKARGPMTPEEIFEQKVSFVYGQMMDCAPDITRDEVRKIVEANR